tara:strand:+ start:403 stop:627 length:225 start_codon:yes stop_codon:yes gene_type:complete
MSKRKDFIEGMGSIYDIRGEKHFNDFKKYPGPKGAIRNIWYNVGCHIDNSANKLARETGISSNPHRRKLLYGKK